MFKGGRLEKKAQKAVQQGKYDRAIEVYKQIFSENPKDRRVQLKIGDLYSKLGEAQAAIDTYREVAAHFSNDGFFQKAIAGLQADSKFRPK